MRLRRIASLTALLSALFTAQVQAQAPEPIKIGFFSHLSGSFAEYGASFKNGVELYLDQVKAEGVGGRPIELLVEDDRNSPQEAAAVARKIVGTPGVVLAIGSWSTTASLAAAPIFTEAKIPQISPTSSVPAFTQSSDFQFRQNNTDDVLAQYNADTVEKQLKEAKTVAIPYSQDDWGISNGKATADVITKDGGKVVLLEGVALNSKDFRPLVSKIKALNPEGVFLALPYQEASILIQQLRQAGVTAKIGGGIPLTSPKFIELAGKAAEGMVLHSIFFAGDPSQKAFTDAYRVKYGRDPDQFAALAYDAAGVGIAAIRRVAKSGKPLTGPAVRDELASGPAYQGVTGITKYDHGNVKKAPVFITIHDGRFQLY